MDKTEISSINFLAENGDYQVYAIYENVFLKDKSKDNLLSRFSPGDLLITDHYGDPTGAIIFPNSNYIIVSGCGLSIYNTERQHDNRIMDEPNKIVWTNGLYQDELDDANLEFRFAA